MSNTIKILKGSKELRERLPHGGVQIIASKYGVSWVWAYRVIMGMDEGNQGMIADAMALAEKYEQLKSVI